MLPLDRGHDRDRERRERLPLPPRRFVDEVDEPERRVLDEDDPENDGDVVYIHNVAHPEGVGMPHTFYFARIRDLCRRLPRTTVTDDGFLLVVSVDTPDDNDRDVDDFKQTVSRLISFCRAYTHLCVHIRFTLVGGNGEKRVQFPIDKFIRKNARGEMFFRFVNDEAAFWALYNDEVYSIIGALCLQSFDVLVVANDSSQSTGAVDGRRFPFQLKDEWAPWSQLMKLAQIHPAASIEFPQVHCLIHALREATRDGTDEPFFTLTQLLLMEQKIKGCYVAASTLDKIAKIGNCTICVNFDPESEAKRRHFKTKVYGPVVHVDLWRNGMARHYIPHKLIPASEWRHLVDFFGIHVKPAAKHLTLLHIVNLLMMHGAFSFPTVYFPYHEYCSVSQGTKHFVPLTQDLVDAPTQYERIEPMKRKKQPKHDLYFADFECLVTGPQHQPFCICYEGVRDTKTRYFYGLSCRDEFLGMLDAKGRDCIVYFHNLGYDGRFLIAGRVEDLIIKGNAIYQMVLVRPVPGTGRDYRVVFRDSLALIPSRLAAFPSMFRLEMVGPKEIFPYHYYTEETMYVGKVSRCGFDEKPQWSLDEHFHFKENLEKLGLLESDNETFNAMEYCLFYCKRDVSILKQGFLKFQRDCKDDFNLDCTDFLTISSLAYRYVRATSFEKQAIFSYNGYIREWIRRAILGGRCMTRQNKKWVCDTRSLQPHVFKKPLVDFDACSLYPSAMNRLLIPKGKPQLIPKEYLTYDWLSAHTMLEQQCHPTRDRFIACYVVAIHVTRNNVVRDFPLLYRRGNGTLTYTNDDNIDLVVSNVYLEDLVRYHGIEFTITEGIMWKDGKSRELSERIQHIYDKRNELKAAGNPKETIYKLMMNSSYGKTIQKMINDDVHVLTKAEKVACQTENSERIRDIQKIDDDHYFVNMYPASDDLFIPIIVGCLILDMSKRIMNEVFDCCHNLDIPVFYQDTDSIHIPKEDVPRLSDRFQQTHGRALIGKQMGQFHSDFPPINGKESWAVKSIFCGKKCYYDKLTNEDGVTAEHFRLKGIPQDVIEKTAAEQFDGRVDRLYEFLHAGNEITFNLLSTRDRFRYTKTFMVVNQSTFIRRIKF